MQNYGIYFRDREFARVQGDPLLGTVQACSKEDAEEQARALGIDDKGAGLWAWPVHSDQPAT